jgi:hypothetical protein
MLAGNYNSSDFSEDFKKELGKKIFLVLNWYTKGSSAQGGSEAQTGSLSSDPAAFKEVDEFLLSRAPPAWPDDAAPAHEEGGIQDEIDLVPFATKSALHETFEQIALKVLSASSAS